MEHISSLIHLNQFAIWFILDQTVHIIVSSIVPYSVRPQLHSIRVVGLLEMSEDGIEDGHHKMGKQTYLSNMPFQNKQIIPNNGSRKKTFSCGKISTYFQHSS